ncbi:MAG: chromosome partitioning protein [Cellulomonas sp.]|jgi:MinD-like ATPase involved in chromosome partitioning or flagellar assembly|nr:chromosome partitioning protein [Cellulomonas sp.]
MTESDTQSVPVQGVAGARPAEPPPTAPGAAPLIVAEVRADGTGYVTVDGVREEVLGTDMSDAGAQITGRIAALADRAGHSLLAEVGDPDGIWMLEVHPDGRVDEAPPPESVSVPVPVVESLAVSEPLPVVSPPASPLPARTPVVAPVTPMTTPAVGQPFSGSQVGAPPLSVMRPLEDTVAADYEASHEPEYRPAVDHAAETAYVKPAYPQPEYAEPKYAEPKYAEPEYVEPEYVEPEYPAAAEPAAQTAASADPPESEQTSLGELLAPRRRRQQTVATQGPRVWVRRLTFGAVSPRPGEAERRHLAAIESVRRTLDGPRTIVVVNPKGGAHKTTATLMLAATLGQQRGGYCLAWDNNETHGTLGWRSATKASGGTALDLLTALPQLLAAGEVRVGDLDRYVRTQVAEQFDVLASDEDAASGAFVDARSFNALHTVLTRFYRTIVVDTGNNIRSSNWRAAVEVADRLVIVTTVREDAAQAAAWAVDALRAAGMADVVRSAVTILSTPDHKVDKDLRERLRQHFGALTRTVVEVPFDPALVAGGPIDFTRLRDDTREAWLQAAAAVVDGL